MASKRPPTKLYSLEIIAAERGWNVSELYGYAKDGTLQICKLMDYSDRAIPLTTHEAALLTYDPIAYCCRNGIRSLVITHKEKMRFDKRYPISESESLAGQHENQSALTSKEKFKKLEKIAQELGKVEKDQDVIAATLRDKYDAKGYHIAKILNIAPHLENKESRNTAARRSADKGMKILAARAALE